MISKPRQSVHKNLRENSEGLPEGWIRAKLPDVAIINMGQSPPGKSYNAEGNGLPFFQGKADFGERYPSVRVWCPDPRKVAHAGDVLLSVRAPVGPTNIADCTCAIGRGLAAVRPTDATTSEYIFFFLRHMEQELSSWGTGSTFTAISKRDIEQIEIDLPSLNEQKRIVAKIEELLPKVNAVREGLIRVKEIMKCFRRSVLAAACSGRLTEDWRDSTPIGESAEKLLKSVVSAKTEIQDGDLAGNKARTTREPNPEFESAAPDSWAIASMDALTSLITSGSRAWKKFYSADGPGTFIMGQNVRPFRLEFSHRIKVNPPESDPDRRRSEVMEGDLLVTIAGNTGDVCRVPGPLKEHYVCQSVALLRPILQRLSPFLEVYLNSPLHGQSQFRELVYGEGRPHLSFEHLKALCVFLPPLEEQNEICRRVCSLFDLAEKAEKRVDAELLRTDKMTQAILAKAFRGELLRTAT